MTTKPLLTFARTAMAALALTALVACGSESESTEPQATTATSAPTAAASSAPASSAPASSAPADTAAPAEMPKSCEILTVDEVNKATGAKFTAAAPSESMGSVICTYTGDTSLSVVSSTTPKAGNVDTSIDVIEKTFTEASTEDISVPGAEKAVVIKGKLSGIAVVDVLVVKDNVIYQAMLLDVTGSADTASLQTKARAAMDIMLG